MTTDSAIKDAVSRYYSGKLAEHGPTSLGVDWNSKASQELRFAQLLTVCGELAGFSINDYGCGYGALYGYLRDRAADFTYTGFDWSEAMVAEAKRLHGSERDCNFVSGDDALVPADYTVASGVFNVKLGAGDADWRRYVIETLHDFDRLSSRGFAFNALTVYSDADRMVTRLHYADPLKLFDYCKRNFSPAVALLHDYELYEFTIVVRK